MVLLVSKTENYLIDNPAQEVMVHPEEILKHHILFIYELKRAKGLVRVSRTNKLHGIDLLTIQKYFKMYMRSGGSAR